MAASGSEREDASVMLAEVTLENAAFESSA